MYQSPRGTQDILPEDTVVWRHVEHHAEATARRFGYAEIRTPTFEETGLFERGVGEGTDIVDKEIYRLQRKESGADLALRPEATASIVRAYLQHGMASRPQPVKLFSLITAFRYDRPQAGRYREFRQFDIEAIGDEDPLIDAEVIGVLWRFLEELGLRDLTIQLNSIGDPVCRPEYVKALVAYYEPHEAELCADCRRRLHTSPLRLLDCKKPGCQPLADNAPRTIDFLCKPCEEHFSALQGYLEVMGLPYELTPRLVRGLDYYTRTVFEVVPPKTGSQAAIGGGGRYDGLAEILGGKPTPGVGFAAGMDRIILNMREQGCSLPTADVPDVFFAPLGDQAKLVAARLAEEARRDGLAVVVGTGDRSMRARMRQAGQSGARFAVILGNDELREQRATVKNLAGGEQQAVPFADLTTFLAPTVRHSDVEQEAAL
ncbi:MAG TPA: histidine--tRNA ligase [Chloroflexota bacterium]|nr:histidine--tRNA ligase [Chloroflexota bacterium]